MNQEAASLGLKSARGAPGDNYLDIAGFSTAEEHNILLYIEAAAAHTQSRKQNTPFIGRGFYFCAASFWQKLNSLHRFKCESHLYNFKEFLPLEIPQAPTVFLPVKKMYVRTVSLFSLGMPDEKESLTACADARA